MVEIAILHADEHLLVVDKPPGLLTVAAPGRSGPTVLDLLAGQLGCRPLPVHRLDEETSGVLVVALTGPAREALEGLFRRHAIERHYLALVAGTPSPPAGRIQGRLREVEGVVRVVTHGGEKAITEYRVLARRGRCSLVTCRLETGRRNQIRVHMAGLGCPVAGDRKYGYRARSGERFPRVMLHSWWTKFTHPLTGEQVDVQVLASEPELHP
jgi:23S rRNA pseudouridine1911/1915/1917 synthase